MSRSRTIALGLAAVSPWLLIVGGITLMPLGSDGLITEATPRLEVFFSYLVMAMLAGAVLALLVNLVLYWYLVAKRFPRGPQRDVWLLAVAGLGSVGQLIFLALQVWPRQAVDA